MKTLLLILLSATAAFGQGTILWDELVNGHLSNLSAGATPLSPFQDGSNIVTGVTEILPTPPNWAANPDYFTVQVPNGSSLEAVFLHIDRPNVWAWIGDPTFSSEIAFVQNPVDGNLLSQWGIGSLGTGDYGIYMLNNDAQPFASVANYRLDFFVQAIPEPGTFWLVVAGAGFVGLRGWRKAQRVRGAR